MEITGKIKVIGKTEEVGINGFTKRLLVVTTSGDYPQDIPIDFVKEKTELLNHYKPGEDVKVSINLRGNEYNDRFYLSAQGWAISELQN